MTKAHYACALVTIDVGAEPETRLGRSATAGWAPLAVAVAAVRRAGRLWADMADPSLLLSTPEPVSTPVLVPTPELNALRRALDGYDRLVVAFSGGVDSALLAWVAHQQLGASRVVAATAVSPSLAPSELAGCRDLAARWGLRWVPVDTDEVSRPDYVANGPDRCFHCKTELMERLAPIAQAEQARVALGVNLDDLADYRPGQRAAREHGAVFPLVDAGFTKDGVRQAARALGLDVWDKPAAACLASRVPHGTPVTVGVLGQVAGAEEALRRLGFAQLRVRHYGDLARLEVPIDQLGTVVAQRAEVVAAVRGAGYRYVTLDLEGFRSGNLNSLGGVLVAAPFPSV